MLLLHHHVQRGLRDAGDAGGMRGGDSEGDLQVPRGCEWGGYGAVVWLGSDPERGAAGAGDSGGEVPDRRGCVERDQLYRAAARGDRDRALEDRKSTRLNSSHANISYAV